MPDYVHPEVLVSTGWVDAHRQDANVRIVESDEDVLLYQVGHVPGAVKIDWQTDLQDAVVRDYIDRAAFAELCARKGIAPDTTVVFYGDKNNWWACYAFWTFKLYGHRDCRIMNGGRRRWEMDGRHWSRDPEPHLPGDGVCRPRTRSGRAGVPRRGAQASAGRQAAGRRPLAGRIHGRDAAHARLSAGRGPPRRPHSRRREHSLVAGRQRRRHVQIGQGSGKAVSQGFRPEAPQRDDRLLPDRRAVEPYLVRAQVPARVSEHPQLRRLVDRMGQHRGRADRQRAGARRRKIATGRQPGGSHSGARPAEPPAPETAG